MMFKWIFKHHYLKTTIFLIIWFVCLNINLTLVFKFSLMHHLQPISHKNNLSWKIGRYIMMEGKWTAIIWRLILWNWRNKTVHENNFYGIMLTFQSNHYEIMRENWAFIWCHTYFAWIYLSQYSLDVILLKLAS